jgi:hypothetical protein
MDARRKGVVRPISSIQCAWCSVLLKIEAGDLNLYYLRSVVDLGSDENG